MNARENPVVTLWSWLMGDRGSRTGRHVRPTPADIVAPQARTAQTPVCTPEHPSPLCCGGRQASEHHLPGSLAFTAGRPG